jgi:Uncharacterized conserved protein
MEKKIEYSNCEVTVGLETGNLYSRLPNVFTILPEVFKPKDKPWIQMEHSNTEAIVNAVKKCPSGALTYYINAAGKESPSVENHG